MLLLCWKIKIELVNNYMETKNLSFDSWTDYDDWLIQNYKDNAIYDVNEVDGKIQISYCSKEEFAANQKK